MLYPMCSRAVLVHGWGCAYIDPVGTGYDGVAKMFRYITLVTNLTYNTRVNWNIVSIFLVSYRLLTLGSTETWAITKPMACWERSDISGLKFLRLTEQGEERLNFFWQNVVNILIGRTRIGLHGWSYGAFLTLAAMTSQKVFFVDCHTFCFWLCNVDEDTRSIKIHI